MPLLTKIKYLISFCLTLSVDSFDRNTIGFTIDLSHFGLSLNMYNIFINKIKNIRKKYFIFINI